MIRDYIAVDVETTGLNPARDRLLEIGAARILNGKVEETYQTFIDAGVEVPERITELTGITDEMRLSGKRPEQAIPEFLEFCGELPILGHNVSFDFGFLKQAAVNQGLTFEREALDTLKIARKLLPDLPSCIGMNQRFSYFITSTITSYRKDTIQVGRYSFFS